MLVQVNFVAHKLHLNKLEEQQRPKKYQSCELIYVSNVKTNILTIGTF